MIEPGPGPDPRRRTLYPGTVGIMIIGVVLALCLNTAYTTWSVGVSQHHWCQVLNLLNESAAAGPPPAGTYGEALVRDFQHLAHGLGCG